MTEPERPPGSEIQQDLREVADAFGEFFSVFATKSTKWLQVVGRSVGDTIDSVVDSAQKKAPAEPPETPHKPAAKARAKAGGAKKRKPSPAKDRTTQLLEALEAQDGQTLSEIGDAYSTSHMSFVQAARSLEKQGRIRREGKQLWLVA